MYAAPLGTDKRVSATIWKLSGTTRDGVGIGSGELRGFEPLTPCLQSRCSPD